jgi:ketosteroid isomerase-like protein
MKKLLALRGVLLLLPLLVVPMSRVDAQPPQSAEAHAELFRTVAALDGGLFDAYNRCDLEKFASFLAEDLEFYHDQTGLSRGRQATVDAVKNNICGKVHRDLVPGSLEVYPLKNYGAVEMGSHRFCDPKKTEKCGEDSGIAKFVMLWQNQDGAWKLTRVISYDHRSSGK